MPPTSTQCITTTMKPIRPSSSALVRIGVYITTLLRCCPIVAAAIGNDDIAMLQARLAIDLQAVPDGGAQRIGAEDRQSAFALGDQASVRIDDTGRVILVFRDQEAERRSRHVLVDEVWNGAEAMDDHFRGDRVDTAGHEAESMDCVHGKRLQPIAI